MNDASRSIRISENVACNYRAINSDKIRVIWELTSRCNLHCKHCFAAVKKVNACCERELSTEEALLIIKQFKSIDVGKVMLTGGEVFVRKDITKIVQAIRSIDGNIIIDITTNALLLDDYMIGCLQEVGVNELSVSIDGPRSVYQSVRGKQASFDRLIRNIHRLVECGFHVDGIMVLNQLTAPSMEETIQMADELKLASLTISDLERLPHSDFDYDALCLSAEQKTECLARLAKLQMVYMNRLAIRTIGFTSCPGAERCVNNRIMAIDRDGFYRRCLNKYSETDNRLDSRSVPLSDALALLNAAKQV